MAFDATDLNRAVTGGHPRLYLYSTNDAAAALPPAVQTYFDSLVSEINVGDMMMIAYDLDGTAGQVTIACDSNDGTNLTWVQHEVT